MPKQSTFREPILVRANSTEMGEESFFTRHNFDGCPDGGYNKCGAWGAGVCKITVNLGNRLTPTSATSDTRLLAIGCSVCEMPVTGISLAAYVNDAPDLNIWEDDYGADGIALELPAKAQAYRSLIPLATEEVTTRVQMAIRSRA